MFKCWKEICSIQDSNLRLALTTIDTASEEGKKLAKAFPECFSAQAQEATVPLDAITQTARKIAAADPDASTLNVEYACEELAIPCVIYAITRRQFAESDHYAGFVTRAWHRKHSRQVGAVVELEDNEYVVLDNRYGELILANTTRVSV